jgi:hypothetical protein
LKRRADRKAGASEEPVCEPVFVLATSPHPHKTRGKNMRSILLMLIGIPLPIILLLAFCTHHF